MTRSIIAATLALLVPAIAVAQDWAKERLDNSPRHLEWVTVKHDDREVNCFLVFPEVEEKVPAIVVIHEIFGLANWDRSLTDQVAEAGYIAIAPDLLSGMGPDGGGTDSLGGPDGARRAMGSLPPDQVTADLNAVVEYARKLPACNGTVAVCGFCWGGRQAFRFATNNQDIAAVYVFYGNGPEEQEAIDRITAPVYGFYGAKDARVNATIPKSVELMEKAGKTYEPVIYEGAGHGFMRAGEAPGADEGNVRGRAAGWERWKKLLAEL